MESPSLIYSSCQLSVLKLHYSLRHLKFGFFCICYNGSNCDAVMVAEIYPTLPPICCYLNTVMGNWIHGFTNWIGFNSQMNPDESTGSAGRVEFELSWALWKAVMMNLSWVLTQYTWIPSESESIIYQKESKNRLHFTITIPSYLSQGGAHGNSQLDTMKKSVAGSFCISMSIVRV